MPTAQDLLQYSAAPLPPSVMDDGTGVGPQKQNTKSANPLAYGNSNDDRYASNDAHTGARVITANASDGGTSDRSNPAASDVNIPPASSNALAFESNPWDRAPNSNQSPGPDTGIPEGKGPQGSSASVQQTPADTKGPPKAPAVSNAQRFWMNLAAHSRRSGLQMLGSALSAGSQNEMANYQAERQHWEDTQAEALHKATIGVEGARQEFYGRGTGEDLLEYQKPGEDQNSQRHIASYDKRSGKLIDLDTGQPMKPGSYTITGKNYKPASQPPAGSAPAIITARAQELVKTEGLSEPAAFGQAEEEYYTRKAKGTAAGTPESYGQPTMVEGDQPGTAFAVQGGKKGGTKVTRVNLPSTYKHIAEDAQGNQVGSNTGQPGDWHPITRTPVRKVGTDNPRAAQKKPGGLSGQLGLSSPPPQASPTPLPQSP